MSRLPVQPTKSNLIKLKEELDFSRTGHQLLQEKREILLLRIRSLINELCKAEETLFTALFSAYKNLETAALGLGWTKLERVHVHPEGDVKVDCSLNQYLGIDLPVFTPSQRSASPAYSPAASNASLDDAQAAFVNLLPLVVDYSERQSQLFALSQALKKTMKRVNALENIFIPDYEETVGYVEETLEEIEREEMYVRKLVKDLKQK
jgi:V/A-type H+-transporting ATPase subunit D